MIASSISLYQVPACCCSSALNVEGGVLGIVPFANYLLSPVHSPWANSLPRCFWEHLSGQRGIAGGPVVTVQCAEHVRHLHPSVYVFGFFFLKSSVKNRRQIWENFSAFIKFVSVKSRRLLFLSPRKMCACICYVGVFLITNLIVLSCDFSRKYAHASKSFAGTCKLK